jgi:hypothetical protein
MSTSRSLYSKITKKILLSPSHKKDILDTLEYLENSFGKEYFDQPTSLQNILRLTAVKFTFAHNRLEDELKTHFRGDQTYILWAKMNFLGVESKIKGLQKIRSQFPDYPQTHLAPEAENTISTDLCESPAGRTVIETNGLIRDLILADPKTLYYLWPYDHIPARSS